MTSNFPPSNVGELSERTSWNPVQVGERLPVLLESVNKSFGSRFRAESLSPLGDEVKNAGISDAPIKYFVSQGTPESEGILFVSRAGHPDTMERTAAKLAAARRRLGENFGSVVLPPSIEGHFQGRSYAIWPRHDSVNMSRLVGLLERKLVARRYLRWQRRAVPHTRGVGDPAAFSRPLELVEAELQFPGKIRNAAKEALDRFSRGRWNSTHVVQHSDMWLGNFLTPRRGMPRTSRFGFFLIDWGSSQEQGYPFIDLVRFCMSAGISSSTLADEVRALAKGLDCDPRDALSYSLCALGHLGSALEQFPKARYLAMCGEVFATLERTGLV